MGKNLTLFAVFCLILMVSCVENPKKKEFDLTLLLKEITQKQILPTLTDFEKQAKKLVTEIEGYQSAPTLNQLKIVRAQWANTAKAYERTYNFHFGPAKSKFLHRAIYNWPTVPETIENLLGSDEFNEEKMTKASPQIRSLAAMEYLLFGEELEAVSSQMEEHKARRDYLLYAAKFVQSQATRLLKVWLDEGEGYAKTFSSNKADGLDGSFNLLYNGLYNAANTAKVTKIGKPGGFEKSPRTNPGRVQAPYSNLSLELTVASLEVIEQAFFGNDHPNISQYIASLSEDELINQRIKTAIQDAKSAVAAIPVPLEKAVESHPEQVQQLHEKLTALNIWMGVDARSVLSVIVTSTDNDGD